VRIIIKYYFTFFFNIMLKNDRPLDYSDAELTCATLMYGGMSVMYIQFNRTRAVEGPCVSSKRVQTGY
jgi:hypothetical protein